MMLGIIGYINFVDIGGRRHGSGTLASVILSVSTSQTLSAALVTRWQ